MLAYNYSDRAQKGQLSTRNFWIARVSRLYPIYLFALLLSIGMLMDEWHARTHAQFTWGVLLTPFLLQGWSPWLSTFWNTPAWTMCTEAFFYLIFPLVILWKRPKKIGALVAILLGLWCLGMVLPTLYMGLHPDGDLHPGRYTDGFWIRALKFSPPPHVPSFLFGIVLADLDALIPSRRQPAPAVRRAGHGRHLHRALFRRSLSLPDDARRAHDAALRARGSRARRPQLHREVFRLFPPSSPWGRPVTASTFSTSICGT